MPRFLSYQELQNIYNSHDCRLGIYKDDFRSNVTKNKLPYYCPRNHFNTKWKSGIKGHKASIHNIGATWYHCDVDGCDYKAKQKSNLKGKRRIFLIKHRQLFYKLAYLPPNYDSALGKVIPGGGYEVREVLDMLV